MELNTYSDTYKTNYIIQHFNLIKHWFIKEFNWIM